jgi:hypothetical protein
MRGDPPEEFGVQYKDFVLKERRFKGKKGRTTVPRLTNG